MLKKNLLSLLVALVIMYLSLTNTEKFQKITILKIPNLDKIVHFGMYFVFMSAIIFVNRKYLENKRHLFLIALIPFFYGILMEILQATLTNSRTGSFFDVVFNSAGIMFSAFLWLWIKASK
jgi:VanZ family protein